VLRCCEVPTQLSPLLHLLEVALEVPSLICMLSQQCWRLDCRCMFCRCTRPHQHPLMQVPQTCPHNAPPLSCLPAVLFL
jgi:hypothetical protein